MAEREKRRATYADLEAVPEHLVAEIIDGELMTHPRPSFRHGAAATSLVDELTGPFQKGRMGPGGWIIIIEPEIKFEQDVLVPDVAGWRKERLPGYPEHNYVEIAPDWICEVLSGSTEKRDRSIKTDAGIWNSDDIVRAPPFDAIEFNLADLWPLDPPLGMHEDPTPYYAGDR